MEQEAQPVETSAATEPASDVKAEEGKLIPIDEFNQGLAPTNHQQLIGFIRQMIAAKAVPKHLQNVPQIISAWNYAAQLRLPPQPSLRNIAMIEGTPSLFGDLPLGLVQKHKDFISYNEYCIDDQYNEICVENKNLTARVWGGVAVFHRRGMEKPKSFSFVYDDAERAGLLRRAKPGMPWSSYPQVMYIRRARIMGIRALFADAISGASIAEDFGRAPDLERDVTPAGSVAEAMNAEFRGADEGDVHSVQEAGDS